MENKEMPQSLETERKVLGIVLREPSLVNEDAFKLLESEDFYLRAHRLVYVAIRTQIQSGANLEPSMISEMMRIEGVLDENAFFQELENSISDNDDFQKLSLALRRLSIRRMLFRLGEKTIKMAKSEEYYHDDIARRAQEKLGEIIRLMQRKTPEDVRVHGEIPNDKIKSLYDKIKSLYDEEWRDIIDG